MTEPKPQVSKVVTALAEVMTKLVGLAKTKKAPPKAGGFSYRGIDDLLDTLHPLLVEAKLILTPRLTGHAVQFHEERSMPYMAEVTVEYIFTSVEDGSEYTVGPVVGTGSASLDKMAGKAKTSAFKTHM